jgi:hypothetical protein
VIAEGFLDKEDVRIVHEADRAKSSTSRTSNRSILIPRRECQRNGPSAGER